MSFTEKPLNALLSFNMALLLKLNASLRRRSTVMRPGRRLDCYLLWRLRQASGCCCKLSSHLFHKLAHAGDISRIAAFNPGFVALRSFFQVREELLIYEPLPSLRDDGLDALPDPEKLAAGLKEEVFVEQTVVEQRAGLVPITEHHHRERA